MASIALQAKAKTVPVIFILGLITLFCVIAIMGAYFSRPQHCVAGVSPDGSPLNTTEYKCFANQADAIYYATGGQVHLPPDASSQDVDVALRAYYEQK